MSHSPRHTAVVVSVIAGSLLMGTWLSRYLQGAMIDPQYTAVQGEKLIDFTLPDTKGKPLSLSEVHRGGKTVVLNFWASWCPPCREEMPDFVAAQKANAASGLQVFGVAVEDDPDVVWGFMESMGVNYPNVLGEDAGIALMERYGHPEGSLPFTVIIGPDGRILAKKLGMFHRGELAATLKKLKL